MGLFSHSQCTHYTFWHVFGDFFEEGEIFPWELEPYILNFRTSYGAGLGSKNLKEEFSTQESVLKDIALKGQRPFFGAIISLERQSFLRRIGLEGQSHFVRPNSGKNFSTYIFSILVFYAVWIDLGDKKFRFDFRIKYNMALSMI